MTAYPEPDPTELVAQADIAPLKPDVAELKTDVAVLKSDVAELKSDVAELRTDVKAGFAAVNQRIDRMYLMLLGVCVSMFVAIIALFIAVL